MRLIAPQSPARYAALHAPCIAAPLVGQASRLALALAQPLQKVARKTGHTPGGAHDEKP
jgi:hypothetical protein